MSDAQAAVVKSAHRLANPEPAGRQECLEDLRDSELLDTISIELFGFVVERHQRVSGLVSQRARDADRRFVGDALRVHELDELLTRELPRGMKHRDLEILIDCDPSLFPLADHFLVAPLKIFRFQVESLHCLLSLLVVSAVRAEHSANVEENVPDFRHAISTARAGAPSQPSMRSGKQMNWYSPGGGADRLRPSTVTTERSRSVRCVRWCPEWNCSMDR